MSQEVDYMNGLYKSPQCVTDKGINPKRLNDLLKVTETVYQTGCLPDWNPSFLHLSQDSLNHTW